jgi:hypothetical protein
MLRDFLKNLIKRIFERDRERQVEIRGDNWQEVARQQFLKLKEKGLSIPVVTL